MSNLNSWEDDPAAQEDQGQGYSQGYGQAYGNLTQQTQQMNLGNNPQNQQNAFRPGASTFRPGAMSFQPGQQFTPQAPQAYGYPYGMQYNQPYVPNQYPQYQNYQQYQQPQQAVPTNQPQAFNANPTNEQPQAAAAPAPSSSTTQPKAKVLSIGNPAEKQTPDNVSSAAKPKTKVLSIAPTKDEGKTESKSDAAANAPIKEEAKDEGKSEAGSKAVANKAVKQSGTGKSGKTSPTPSSGRSSPSRSSKSAAAREADAVEKEQTADVDDDTLKELYGKESLNIIFLGHVDAGKSTLGGAVLYTTGMVDQRTLDKYKREAKEMGRETWYLSWALDLTNEERSKGKTVEVGRGYFETEKRRYAILDAPGHKNYVPNMIGGASQADVGILVISARKGEYETGFERGGQTREHAMLAKTQGVNKLVVAVNKMDDPTAQWSEERFKECTTKLGQFLKGVGYDLKRDVFFMPIAAQSAIGIKERVPKDLCPWYDGPSLLEYLDSMQAIERKLAAPFMMAVAGKYRDLGTMVEGKIEAGVVKKSMDLIMMPNKHQVEVAAVYTETEEEVSIAQCGSQVRLRLRGIEEDDILPGFVLCSPKRLVHRVSSFEAQVRILEIPNILTAGFNCVLHVHAAVEEVTFAALLHTLQKGTGRKSKRPPTHAKRGDSIIARLQVTSGVGSVCVEKFEDYPQMGRFTLRNQGQTIAIGKITKLITDGA
ncbi:P-loop containing nucleoside triphosphate hydrolase protein [Xylariaceae sp. FL0662B]|nr:P-loop containing nucleoside triphosphate hydrolase protein [Xylariaceae sp. FL0662B]